MNVRYRASCAAIAASLGIPAAQAVSLNPDGLGQALIFPYYTAQSSNGDPFNTFLQIVNPSMDAKALRVRFCEARASKEVLAFNLFLAAKDAWAGAVVPSGAGAELIVADTSCMDPAAPATSRMPFRADRYAGDGNGDGIERANEGFVEVLEMATLTGDSAAGVFITSRGIPGDCSRVIGEASPTVGPPSGSLSGSLTLINVASGMDFTLDADALDDLARTPYYRRASDPYPDFNAAEIDPVSVVVRRRAVYRSTWPRAVDAVSAVLMRETAIGELVVDESTRSRTDLVMTFPTRHFYAGATTAAKPFSAPARWQADCGPQTGPKVGERLFISVADRNSREIPTWGDCEFATCPPSFPSPSMCAASAIVSLAGWWNQTPSLDKARTVLASLTRGYTAGTYPAGVLPVTPLLQQSGWTRLRTDESATMTSLPTSTRTDVSTGEVATGAHTFRGLPITGFTVRTFENGTLRCGAGACQGNYGGAFPFKYGRNIGP